MIIANSKNDYENSEAKKLEVLFSVYSWQICLWEPRECAYCNDGFVSLKREKGNQAQSNKRKIEDNTIRLENISKFIDCCFYLVFRYAICHCSVAQFFISHLHLRLRQANCHSHLPHLDFPQTENLKTISFHYDTIMS